jgi:hypothetical protein
MIMRLDVQAAWLCTCYVKKDDWVSLPDDVNTNVGLTPLGYFSFRVETKMLNMREEVQSKCKAFLDWDWGEMVLL